MQIINFYKNLGETPKEALGRLQRENPEYGGTRLTYAGRLDPMAEGVLLILTGDYTEEEKLKILNLPKTYYFEVLWGFKSDSFDILGKPNLSGQSVDFGSPQTLEKTISEIKNLTEMQYPPFSSRTVNGKPLFKLAREGKIGEVEIPKKQIKIFSLEYVGEFEISGKELLDSIIQKISLVKGDFRQVEILDDWKKILQNRENKKFLISSFRAEVSSGVYVRGIANTMGQKMKTGALAYKIIRERVGDFSI